MKRWRLPVVVGGVSVVVIVLAVGLWLYITQRAGANVVDIVAEQVRDDGSGFHWKWLVRGTRPWERMTCDDHSATLVHAAGVQGALGSRFGPYDYTFDLDVCSGDGDPSRSRYQWAHKADGFGGNLGSNNARSVDFPGVDRDERFRAIQKEPSRVRLPARVPLAVVDGQTVYLDLK